MNHMKTSSRHVALSASSIIQLFVKRKWRRIARCIKYEEKKKKKKKEKRKKKRKEEKKKRTLSPAIAVVSKPLEGVVEKLK